MPKTSDFLRLALVTTLALSLGTGCTKAAKKARYQTEAENDFKAGSYDKAKIEYLNVLRFDPQNATAFTRLGQMWLEEGAPLKAGAFLVKASELEPNDLENRLRLARTYQAVGRHDQAKKEVLFVLQHSPEDGEALLLLSEIALSPEEIASAEQALQKSTKESAASQLAAANLAIRKSDLKAAGTSISRALELEPKSPRAHQSAGILALLQQDQKKAGAEFKTAAELSPARSNLKTVYPEYLLKTGATDQAKEYLQGLTSKTPDFLPAWILQARIAFAAKNYDQTLALLENVISRDADNLDARVLQANSWLAQNENAKAVSALERLNTSHPGAPALKVELAKAYIQSGKFPQAAAVLQEAVTASPNYADAVLLLSEINLRNGQAGPAITALEGLLKTRPDLVKAQTLLADAYRAAGRLDDSAAVFRQQIARTPEKPEPYFFLGVVQRQQNKTADARQSFNKALELAPDSSETLTQLVELDLVAKDFAGAMSRVLRLQEKKPNDAFPYLLAGKVRAAQKQWPEAETALKKAIQLNPELSTAYDLLVAIYLSTNRLPQAAQELESILVQSPQNQPALMALASLREKEKNYAKAAELYGKLLAFKSDSVPALNNLAYLDAERLNQLGNAQELARKARTLAPADPAVADTLGWVLFKSGDYEQALELVSEAAGKTPNSPEVQFHLGMAHYMMGQTKAAASAFQHALSTEGDFPSKTEAQRRLAILEQTSKGGETSGVGELEAMVKQYPNDVIARMKLGELYARQSLFDRAATAYREALKLNPKLAPVALKLTQLYAGPLHDPAAALEFAKKARDLAPNDPQVTGTLGKIAFDAGNYTWAYSLLQDSARQSDAGAPVFYHFAWAAYSLGKVEQARKVMEKTLQASPEPQMAQDAQTFLALTALGPEDPGALVSAEPRIREKLAADPNYVPAVMAAAASDNRSGKTQEAIVRYQSVLRRFPDFAPAQTLLARLYANDPERLAEAYDLASKARKTLPGDPAIAALLGKLSYQKKEYPRAIQLLQESDRAKPLDATGLYYLGMADKESNHPTDAKKALSKALAKGLPQPLTESAQKAQGELDKKP